MNTTNVACCMMYSVVPVNGGNRFPSISSGQWWICRPQYGSSEKRLLFCHRKLSWVSLNTTFTNLLVKLAPASNCPYFKTMTWNLSLYQEMNWTFCFKDLGHQLIFSSGSLTEFLSKLFAWTVGGEVTRNSAGEVKGLHGSSSINFPTRVNTAKAGKNLLEACNPLGGTL